MFIYCICTQYLVGAPFALITASIRCGMEVISLWHCWGGVEAQVSLTVAFSSSAFFGLLFLIFLLTIPSRFSMGFRSGEFAGQSSTPTPWSFNQLLVLLAVWAGAKSCWITKSASLKSWSAEGRMKCSKIGIGKRGQWRWFSKNTMDQHQQITLHPNHHRLWKLNTGLQATWAMSFFTLPPDSMTLVSKLNTKLAFTWKEYGPIQYGPNILGKKIKNKIKRCTTTKGSVETVPSASSCRASGSPWVTGQDLVTTTRCLAISP